MTSVRKLHPSLRSCLCHAKYNEGFRDKIGCSFEETEKTVPVEIQTWDGNLFTSHSSHRETSSPLLCPHPLKSSPELHEGVRSVIISDNAFFNSVKSEQITQISIYLAWGFGGGGLKSHCSHHTYFATRKKFAGQSTRSSFH